MSKPITMFCTSLCRRCLETSFSEFSVLLLRHAQSNVQKLCSLPDWPGICHLGWWLWYDYVMFFVMSDWSKMPPHCHASIYFNIFNMRSFLANSPPGKIQNLLGGMHDESLHAQVPYAPPKATAKPEPLPANSPLSSGGSVVLQARLSWVRGSEAGSEKRRAFENCELQWTWEASKHRLRPDIEDSVGGSPGLLAVWHLNPNRSKRSCRVGDMRGVCFFLSVLFTLAFWSRFPGDSWAWQDWTGPTCGNLAYNCKHCICQRCCWYCFESENSGFPDCRFLDFQRVGAVCNLSIQISSDEHDELPVLLVPWNR